MTAKYIALIPVRKGSRSIPLKNAKDFAGRPLFLWVAEAACNCKRINSVYVATDSDIIMEAVSNQEHFDPQGKLKVVSRKPENATDKAPMVDIMLEFAEKVDFKNLIVIQATSPLLRSDALSAGIAKFESQDYDSVVSVVNQDAFIWKEHYQYAFPVNHELLFRPNRQEFKGALVENGAFIIRSREALMESKARLSGKVGLYQMSRENYLQIDKPSDWIAIEALLKYRINFKG